MADAKVIPFDDDRSRSGGASRPARRRTGAGGGSGGRGDGPAAPVSALPGAQAPGRPPRRRRPGGAAYGPEGPGRGGFRPGVGRRLGAADRGRSGVPAAAGDR